MPDSPTQNIIPDDEQLIKMWVHSRAASTLQSLPKGEVQPDDPVFVSKKGGHLTPCQVWLIVKTAAGRAGIKAKVSPHWLRHAYASHSLDRGCSLSLLQQSLGHSSAATTSRYLHAKPDDSAGLYLGL